jgi:flagellin-like protein
MKIPTTDSTDRGQVGIGTLIIFIALVLVAAVAAGVLVNTAGELQSRASDTGDDAQAQVSNQIDVVSATGEDATAPDGSIEKVTLVVKKSPGSDPINVSEATIQYTSPSNSQTLTVTGGSVELQDEAGTTIGPTGDQVLDDTSERIKIVITLPASLAEGESAELKIVDQSGASTVYGVNVPEVVTDTYVSV